MSTNEHIDLFGFGQDSTTPAPAPGSDLAAAAGADLAPDPSTLVSPVVDPKIAPGTDYFDPTGRGSPLMPMDEALDTVFQKYGMARLGGASGRGWSSRSVLQACPYKFKVFYLDGLRERGAPAPALMTGSCYHAFLAIGYQNLITPTPLSPTKLREELLALPTAASSIEEAWRLYVAYTWRYQQDYLKPLGVEEWAKDESTGLTCRYDLIAKVDDPNSLIPKGTWIVEHKSASRFDQGTLDGWFNDGEVLGQMLIWPRAKLAKKYGKLQGVIVNLVSKTKQPNFERIIVPALSWQTKQHEADMRALDMLEQIYRTTGVWPRFRQSCVGRYGKCPLFDHCADRTS